MDKLIYWIWLSLAVRPSGTTFGKLIKEYPDAKAIYDAEEKKISSIIGFRNSDRTNLADKNLDRPKEIYSFCKKHNVGIITFDDEKFPKSLREISNPPVLLYYRGVLPDFNNALCIGAVGTRSLSEYGRKHTFNISYDLATAGATIVSGMAIGIDGVALAGALAAGGKTVAVLGSGIDVCYPPQHLTLAREIVKSGCVLTEYAPGSKPTKFSFPSRNRIISGLSAATVVFEGPEKSGALITARYAMEQGKVVYALPANIGERNGQLCGLLIKNGAKICTCADDIINNFSKTHPAQINPFNLKERLPVDMMESLRAYCVSAVCPSDDIFVAPRSYGQKNTKFNNSDSAQQYDEESCVKPPESFDKSALSVYKKIPMTSSCSIESLVSDSMGLREVMKCLLKLEVGGFITMLPGEMVARKFK